jgi:hypothetical protein
LSNAAASAVGGWALMRPALGEVGRRVVQLVCVVALLCLLTGFESWTALTGRLMSELQRASPEAAGVAQAIGQTLFSIIEVFRRAVRALFESAPGTGALLPEAIVAGVFLALAHWPSGAMHFRAWRSLTISQKHEIMEAAQAAGLKCGLGDARLLFEALEAFDWERRYPGAMTESESKRLVGRYVEKARARFGDGFDAFARAQKSLGGVPPRLFRTPAGVALNGIWIVVALAATFAAIDWAFFVQQ